MTLQFIDLDQLTVSKLNVRKYGAKDSDDLVTSIRAMGVLQPLLVRPAEEGYEVIAGQRRLNACRVLAEDGEASPLPCLIMAEGDDVTAIEASLAENIERLPMDEVDQYKAFAKLVSEGRDPADIAHSFGITERMVSQRLALGRLHAPILTAYRKGDIHARDIRILTMATTKQQKAWWALVKDEEAYVPSGQRLKDWLFGGAHIPTSNALFDVDTSGLAFVSDLFGEDAYFADAEAFWLQQSEAISQACADLKAQGWADVVVMDQGAYFATWDHRATSKDNGGKVFVTCSHQGEVSFHKGYLTNAEAKRREKAENGEAIHTQPELTKAGQNYVDLHRHAAVRADLLQDSGTALRLIAAHMIAGSDLWQVEADPQKAAKPEIADSLEKNIGHHAFEVEQQIIAEMLGLDHTDSILSRRDIYAPRPSLEALMIKLSTLSDEDVLRILTLLMAASLSVQSPLIDCLAGMMGTDMAQHWTPEQTFFDLIRDKQVLNAMVGEVAGKTVAEGNAHETAKTRRKILCDCLDGTRVPVDANWMPRYMAFPQGTYREDAPDNTGVDVTETPTGKRYK